jgi:hypothetical protein
MHSCTHAHVHTVTGVLACVHLYARLVSSYTDMCVHAHVQVLADRLATTERAEAEIERRQRALNEREAASTTTVCHGCDSIQLSRSHGLVQLCMSCLVTGLKSSETETALQSRFRDKPCLPPLISRGKQRPPSVSPAGASADRMYMYTDNAYIHTCVSELYVIYVNTCERTNE